MRCSSRDRGLMIPSFMTSTPLPRRRPTLPPFDEKASFLSSIAESPLIAELQYAGRSKKARTMLRTSKSTRAPLNLVIASSDSEEEDIVQSLMVMPKSRKRSNVTRSSNLRDETKKRCPVGVVEPQKNFLDELASEKKTKVRRGSRVDAILSEIVKEHTMVSNVVSPPTEKELNVQMDTMIEKDSVLVVGSQKLAWPPSCTLQNKETAVNTETVQKQSLATIQNINQELTTNDQKERPMSSQRTSCSSKLNFRISKGIEVERGGRNVNQMLKNNNIDIKPVKRQSKKEKGLLLLNDEENKENIVRKIKKGGHDVDVFVVPDMQKNSRGLSLVKSNIITQNNLNMRRKLSNAKDLDYERNQAGPSEAFKRSCFNDSDIANHVILDATTPVVFLAKDIKWKPCEGHEGVSIFKCPVSLNTSEGYLKLGAKTTFKNTAPHLLKLIVTDGNGEVTIGSKTTRLSSSDSVVIPVGCYYEVLNRGVKKDLVMNYILWK